MKRPSVFLPASILFFVLTRLAVAGPPLLTDDPETPGPNHWEINLAYTSEWDEHEWLLETPLVDANYGVGDNIQLKYQVPYEVLIQNGQQAQSDFGPSLVGVKWRFLDQDKQWLDVSTYPQFGFNFSEGAYIRGFSLNDGWAMLLPVEIEHTFGRLKIYGETGYIWNEYLPEQWIYGIAGEYALTKKWALMGEVWGLGSNHSYQNYVVFNLGFSWQFSEHVALIGSAGRAIVPDSSGGPGLLTYLAAQLTF